MQQLLVQNYNTNKPVFLDTVRLQKVARCSSFGECRQAGGRNDLIESVTLVSRAGIAQLVERIIRNDEVGGSNPSAGTVSGGS